MKQGISEFAQNPRQWIIFTISSLCFYKSTNNIPVDLFYSGIQKVNLRVLSATLFYDWLQQKLVTWAETE